MCPLWNLVATKLVRMVVVESLDITTTCSATTVFISVHATTLDSAHRELSICKASPEWKLMQSCKHSVCHGQLDQCDLIGLISHVTGLV